MPDFCDELSVSELLFTDDPDDSVLVDVDLDDALVVAEAEAVAVVVDVELFVEDPPEEPSAVLSVDEPSVVLPVSEPPLEVVPVEVVPLVAASSTDDTTEATVDTAASATVVAVAVAEAAAFVVVPVAVPAAELVLVVPVFVPVPDDSPSATFMRRCAAMWAASADTSAARRPTRRSSAHMPRHQTHVIPRPKPSILPDDVNNTSSNSSARMERSTIAQSLRSIGSLSLSLLSSCWLEETREQLNARRAFADGDERGAVPRRPAAERLCVGSAACLLWWSDQSASYGARRLDGARMKSTSQSVTGEGDWRAGPASPFLHVHGGESARAQV